MARSADPRVRAQIAKNLKRLIGARRIGDMAKALDMPQAQLSGYANGHRGFSVEMLLRFGVALRCSLDDLVAGVDREYSRSVIGRVHPELEADAALMDVVTGFDLIRRDNPGEAAGLAEMFRRRMLAALSLHAPAESDAASSPDVTALGTRSRPGAAKRRRGAR